MGAEPTPQISPLRRWIANASRPNAGLIKAVKQNKVYALRAIVNNPAKASLIDPESFVVALDYAVQKGFLECVPALLIHGPKADQAIINEITNLATQKPALYVLETMQQLGLQPVSETLRCCLETAIKRSNWKLLEVLSNFPRGGTSRTLDLALFLAFQCGSPGVITFLLRQGADYQPCPDDFGDHGSLSVLCKKAVEVNNDYMLKWLFAKGVNAWSVYGSTSAVVENTSDRQMVNVREIVIECGGRPDQRILLAGLYGRLVGMKSLMEQGVSVNSMDEDGNTVLHYAIQRVKRETMQNKLDKIELCSYLLENGAFVNVKNHLSVSPLRKAVESGRVKITGQLLITGAQVDRQILGIAARASQNRVTDESINTLLLEHGGKRLIEELNDQSQTVLHEAAQCGKASTVRQLLEAGANIHAVDARGWSALHFATTHPRSDTGGVLKVLFDSGCSLEAEDNDRRRPLQIAVESQNYTAMWQLRRLGANCESITRDGRTIDQLISDEDMREMWLTSTDIDMEYPLLDHARAGKEDIVLKLVKCGANLGLTTDDGSNVLHFFNNSQTKRKLILAGMNPYVRSKAGRLAGMVYRTSSQRALGMLLWQHDYFAGVQYPGPGLEDGWELTFVTPPRGDGSGGGLPISCDLNGDSSGNGGGGSWDGDCGDGGGGGDGCC